MNRRQRRALGETVVSGPSFLWLLALFAIPTAALLVTSLRPADIYGGVAPGWTFANYLKLLSPERLGVVWRTVWISAVATIICVTVAVPVAYRVALCGPRLRRWLLLLLIAPFWTNFLIRVFAWKIVLGPDGWFRLALLKLGIIDPGTMLLYNKYTTLMVIVYTYLPFAIMPLFAAVEKFDFSLLEAARDLGAGRSGAFFKVFVPGVSKGIAAAALMVFIPALGSYVIPDMVGGVNSQMIGNLIADCVFVGRDIPAAAAWASLLVMMVVGFVGLRLTLVTLGGVSLKTRGADR